VIRHHPDEATLLQYATGAMPEVLKIVTATHLTFCTVCRDALADLEMLGGILLEEIDPLPMCGVVRPPASFIDLGPPPIVNPDLPAPLNRIPLRTRWWPVSAGFWWRMMHVPRPGWGGLLWGRPGSKLPRHRHRGLELACVLAGSFIDSSGEYSVGDISDPEASEHAEVAIMVTGSEPCLCVLASEGMHLRGILGLMQRIVG
jgi:putative transcriptional regulator